jgi:hypothetical protein
MHSSKRFEKNEIFPMFTKEPGLNKALIMALINIQNYFVCVLVLCTQVNMMFVMLL